MALGGTLSCVKAYATRQTTSGVPTGLSAGDRVLLMGQGGAGSGNIYTADNDNGPWIVASGAWTKIAWDSAAPVPHIMVGAFSGENADVNDGLYTLKRPSNGILAVRAKW